MLHNFRPFCPLFETDQKTSFQKQTCRQWPDLEKGDSEATILNPLRQINRITILVDKFSGHPKAGALKET